MRILHVIADLHPAKGGPATVVKGLTEGQARCGHQISVAVSVHRTSWWPEPKSIPVLAPREPGGIQETITRFDADFVHMHGLWCSTIQDAARACNRLGVPFALAPHGALGAWSMSQKGLKKHLALALGYGAPLTRAKFVHVNNSDEYDVVRKRFPLATVREIPHGIDASNFKRLPGVAPFLERFPHFQDLPFILFLGRLAHQKAPDLMVRAFAIVARHFPEVQLVLAGPDDGRASQARQEAERLETGVRERVHFLGPLYGDQKWSAYQAARVFCLPSRYESFGLTIVEAMSCSAPVVVTDTCYFPDVSESGAGLIATLDENTLAKALQQVLCDEAAARTMGERGRALVEQKYTWDAISRRIIEEYQNHL